MKPGSFFTTSLVTLAMSASVVANTQPDGTLTQQQELYKMPTVAHEIHAATPYKLSQAPLLNFSAITTPGEDDYQQFLEFKKRSNPPGIKDLDHPVHSLRNLRTQKPYFLR